MKTMKQILILLSMMLLLGCNSKKDQTISDEEIKKVDGIVYQVGKGKPFTGVVESKYLGESLKWNYENGVLNGVSKGYYENGNLKYEQNYKNGILDGKMKLYYENGKIEVDGNYKNGKAEGVWKSYYEDGKLKGEGKFGNGNREGVWKKYSEDGKVIQEENFKNGEKI